MRNKSIILCVLISAIALSGCGAKNKTEEYLKEVEEKTTEENVVDDSSSTDDSEEQNDNIFDTTIAGWHIVVEDYQVNSSLENVSVALGYTNVETTNFEKKAQDGKTFCLVKLNIEKVGSKEVIAWDNFVLKDGTGSVYNRIDDEFILDLGMLRMPGTDLNFGQNEGWIAYEIDENAKGLMLEYSFENEKYQCALSDDAIEMSDNLIKETDIFEAQRAVDEGLKAELEAGYTFEEPTVIVDPYNAAPLSAVVIFTTDEEVAGKITVKGHDAKDDIVGEISLGKEHIVPVYGLYNNDTTEVELTLDDGRTNTLSIKTEDCGLAVGDINVEMIDESKYDYSKLTFISSLMGSLYAVDSKGDVRWFFTKGGTLGVHELSNGHLMLPTTYVLKTSYYRSGLQEIDYNGRVYAEYSIPGGEHHDFQELNNGNILVAGDAPDLSSVEDYVVEIDRKTGEVVWSIDMKDIIPIEDGQSASMNTDGSPEEDWFHNNSLWYDAKNDLILLSARHKDAIVAVKKSDKSLAWILGDPNGWKEVDSKYFFTPVGKDFEWMYAQHEVTMLDNGDVMCFDNGTAKVKREADDNRVTGDSVYSRAVAYKLNTDEMTIEQSFEYGKDRGSDWYADWVSGAESLDGTTNNVWITSGSHLHSDEEKSSDYGPTGMMKPGLIKSTHIDQVVNNKLIYEIVVSGETAGSLSFRSSRFGMYDGEVLDLKKDPMALGHLSETPYEEIDLSGYEVSEFDNTGWTFTLDGTKLAVAGTYTTSTLKDDLSVDYMILKNDNEVRAYATRQNATEKDGNTSVMTNAWASRDGIGGEKYNLYMLTDGKLYDTGYEVAM